MREGTGALGNLVKVLDEFLEPLLLIFGFFWPVSGVLVLFGIGVE